MCRCTPNMRTPFCGKTGCEWPPQVTTDPEQLRRLRELRTGEAFPRSDYVAPDTDAA